MKVVALTRDSSGLVSRGTIEARDTDATALAKLRALLR